MDQKTAAALDPKLKEVYDRVMGTSGQPSTPIPPTNTPATPNNPAPTVSAPLTPITPPSIGLTPPITSPSPASPMTPATKPTLPPLPEHPMTPSPLSSSPTPPMTPVPTPISPDTSIKPEDKTGMQSGPADSTKPTVDYAAIAAKYATPLPPINTTLNSSPKQSAPAVTPSGTTYGVVNGSSTDKQKEQTAHTEKSGSPLKKILLIIGIPIFIVVYAAIWIIVFKVDIMSFIPLPK